MPFNRLIRFLFAFSWIMFVLYVFFFRHQPLGKIPLLLPTACTHIMGIRLIFIYQEHRRV